MKDLISLIKEGMKMNNLSDENIYRKLQQHLDMKILKEKFGKRKEMMKMLKLLLG